MSDSSSDEVLMAAYQAGNEAAFATLFDRYAGRVYGFLVRRTGDAALAEEIYQEAFLRLHRARASYELGRAFRPWLFSIVHNLLNDVLRQRRRAPEMRPLDAASSNAALPDGNGAMPSHAETLASLDPSPEDLLATRELEQALGRVLRSLPSDEATVLILARFEGLSYDDIGSIIGRSAPATKQLAYRALKRVRAELAAGGYPEGV